MRQATEPHGPYEAASLTWLDEHLVNDDLKEEPRDEGEDLKEERCQQDLYRQLIALRVGRHVRPALSIGILEGVEAVGAALVYCRRYGTENLAVRRT